jgi:hypothetical protein
MCLPWNYRKTKQKRKLFQLSFLKNDIPYLKEPMKQLTKVVFSGKGIDFESRPEKQEYFSVQ